MNRNIKILLTNDDGFSAPGIRYLYDSIKNGNSVTVIAPEKEQSGVGHAFTYKKLLMYKKCIFKNNVEGYSVSGTPSDCVKIGLGHILSEKPDVVVSGINYGSNTGIAVYYSGTVAAAREAAFWRIPGIAFSISEDGISFVEGYSGIAVMIIEKIIANCKKMVNNNKLFFNVNFPSCNPDNCSGLRITKQSQAFYNDKYKPVKTNDNSIAYQLYSERMEIEDSDDYDVCSVENNFISVTPLCFDETAEDSLNRFFHLEDII